MLDLRQRRFALVEEECQRNNTALNSQYPGLGEVVCQDIKTILADPKLSPRAKILWIRRVADEFNHLVTPYTACRHGCSYCCYIPAEITEVEAGLIGKAIGRKPKKISAHTRENWIGVDDYRDRYTGVPCPFLKKNRCSIYEDRPIGCRLHHNLSDSAEMCSTELEHEDTRVPKVDLREAEVAIMMALAMKDGAFQCGDIRDYFPHG